MKHTLALVLMVFGLVGCAPAGNIYAVCEHTGRHIAYTRGHVTLNHTDYKGHNHSSTYKVRGVFRTDRIVWNNHHEDCEMIYGNPYHSFEWDFESGKARYYFGGAGKYNPSIEVECKILPANSAPDWVKFKTTDVYNDDCGRTIYR